MASTELSPPSPASLPNPRRGAATVALCVFCAALPLSIAGANIGWGLLFAALVFSPPYLKRLPFSAARGGLFGPLLAYLCAAAISSALGIDPVRSFGYLNQDLHKLWLYCLLCVALSLEADPAEALPRPLLFLAAGFAAAASLGILQAVVSIFSDAMPWDRVRAHAFVHPVTYGEQMCVAVLGAFCFLLRPTRGLARKAERSVLFALLALTAAALFLSHTRAAIFACLLGVMAVFFLDRRLRSLLPWTLPALFAVFIATEFFRPDRSLSAEFLGWRQPAYAKGGQLMRVHVWDAALRMGRDNLWTGVGQNNFRSALPRYLSGELDGRATSWGTAHNLYLHHFAERGFLGLGALLLLLGFFAARALQRALRRPDAWQLWAFSTAVAFLVMNLTEVALQTEILWMLVFFVWIWAEALFRRAEAPG